MPNISETVCETYTKLSEFWRSSLGYSVQNMEGICLPNFWGKGRKVETLTPYLQNGRSGKGSKFFCAAGAFAYSKIKS